MAGCPHLRTLVLAVLCARSILPPDSVALVSPTPLRLYSKVTIQGSILYHFLWTTPILSCHSSFLFDLFLTLVTLVSNMLRTWLFYLWSICLPTRFLELRNFCVLLTAECLASRKQSVTQQGLNNVCGINEHNVSFKHVCIFQEREGPWHSSKPQKGCELPKGAPIPPLGAMMAKQIYLLKGQTILLSQLGL